MWKNSIIFAPAKYYRVPNAMPTQNSCPYNSVDCPCTKDCPRHGKCCECVKHHKDAGTNLPTCLRGIDWLLPSVVTIDPGENIPSSSIGAVGNVKDDGGFEVTVRGFVYSTLPYPSLDNGVNIEAGSGVGYFSANITGITPAQKPYYIRAYATNERGTIYGEQVVITPERAQYASLKTMSYGGYTYKIKFIGSLSWGSGMSTCANMKLGDYDDWFMPNDSEVQAILDAYKVWNVLSATETNLMVEGCTELWSSNKANTGYAHYYHIDCSDSYCDALKWLCNNSAFAASTDGIKGVFAVRKYRTEN